MTRRSRPGRGGGVSGLYAVWRGRRRSNGAPAPRGASSTSAFQPRVRFARPGLSLAPPAPFFAHQVRLQKAEGPVYCHKCIDSVARFGEARPLLPSVPFVAGEGFRELPGSRSGPSAGGRARGQAWLGAAWSHSRPQPPCRIVSHPASRNRRARPRPPPQRGNPPMRSD